MKKVLSVLLAVLLIAAALPMSAAASSSDFNIQGERLVSYNGPGGDVVVPDGVTSIASLAFMSCRDITSVTIPEGVVSIGDKAFDTCDKMTRITLPSSIKSIGSNAFSDCSALKSITIPSGVTEIQDGAFWKCSSLTDITIPDTVTTIGVYAFFSCDSLTNVVLPEGLVSFQMSAFDSCSGLTSITIPESVSYIGYNAFMGCQNLKTAVFKNSEVEFGNDMAFMYCRKLTIYGEAGSPLEAYAARNRIHFVAGDGPTPEPTPVPTVGGFSDVTADRYYAQPVVWAVQKGITSGKGSTTTFKPNDTCTRAEIMTFIWASEGKPDPTGTAPFSDMPTLSAFRSAISWAVEKGVTGGIGGGRFGTTAPCTRVQAVTFLWAAAGKPQPSTPAMFSDMTGSQIYDSAISWAVENQITSGAGNNRFDPNKRCTRAEIVTFLHKAYQ